MRAKKNIWLIEVEINKTHGIELDKDIVEDWIHEYYNIPHVSIKAKILSSSKNK